MMLDDVIAAARRFRDSYIKGQEFSVKSICSIESVNEFLTLVENCERFDFGDLPLELQTNSTESGYSPNYVLPKLTDDEFNFWEEGLIPLPAPTCWYEMKINNVPSGILVTTNKENGLIYTQRVECNKNNQMMIDGTWVRYINQNTTQLFNDNKSFLKMAMIAENRSGNMYSSNAFMMIYLTLMINSRSTELCRVEPSKDRLRLSRLLRRPLPKNHTKVIIVPKKYIEYVPSGEKGTHASPRLHWRRSHVRTLHSGTDKEVRCVVARHLVGRRELGEISHEYTVRIPT